MSFILSRSSISRNAFPHDADGEEFVNKNGDFMYDFVIFMNFAEVLVELFVKMKKVETLNR